MQIVQGSAICRFFLLLWQVLLNLYGASVLACVFRTVAAAWKRWWHASALVRFFFEREGLLPHAWRYSVSCRLLTVVVNLPVTVLHWVYLKLRRLFDASFFAHAVFGMGEQVPIAVGWLMALIMIIPYERWSNGYSFMAYVLLFLLGMAGGMRRRSLRMDVFHIGPYFVCFFAAVCLSWPLSAFPALSGRYLSYHITCALCVLLIVSTVEREEQLVRLGGFTAIGLGLTSAMGVLQRIQGVEVNRSTVDLSLNTNMPGRVFSVFDNANAFAEVLVLLVPIAVALLLGMRSKGWKLIGLGAAGLGCIALLMTYSRASWVGMAVAVLVFVFLWNRKLLPALFVLAAACIPFLPDTILTRIQTIFNPNDSSTSSRLPLYEAAVKGVISAPVTGAGLGADAVRQYVKEYGLYHGDAPFTHSHNIYLQLWLEHGLLGIAAFTAGCWSALKQGARAAVLPDCPKQIRMITLGAVSGLAGSLVCGLADYLFTYPRVMLIFWFTVALMLAGVKLAGQKKA